MLVQLVKVSEGVDVEMMMCLWLKFIGVMVDGKVVDLVQLLWLCVVLVDFVQVYVQMDVLINEVFDFVKVFVLQLGEVCNVLVVEFDVVFK